MSWGVREIEVKTERRLTSTTNDRLKDVPGVYWTVHDQEWLEQRKERPSETKSVCPPASKTSNFCSSDKDGVPETGATMKKDVTRRGSIKNFQDRRKVVSPESS